MANVGERVTEGREYLAGVSTELKKVHWPSRQETLAFTGVVVVVVAFVSVYLGIVDFVLSRLLALIF